MANKLVKFLAGTGRLLGEAGHELNRKLDPYGVEVEEMAARVEANKKFLSEPTDQERVFELALVAHRQHDLNQTARENAAKQRAFEKLLEEMRRASLSEAECRVRIDQFNREWR